MHVILSLLWSAPALAQDHTLTVQQEALLGAHMAELAMGAGAPSVVWDPGRSRLHLFFEAQVEEPGCPEAWEVRAATSTDGVNWDLAGTPVAPSPATPCGGRRPAVYIDSHDQRFLYFDVVDAVGGARIALHLSSAGQRSDHVLPELDGLISPTVARWGDQWLMLAVRDDPLDPAVVAATSADGMSWTVEGDAIPAGTFAWDGALGPSVSCSDVADYPWEFWYGAWQGATTSWSWGVTDDLSAWYVLTPALISWTDDTAWVSADVLQAGDERLVFYEDLDADGLPRIGLAATTDAWSLLELQPLRCFDPTP